MGYYNDLSLSETRTTDDDWYDRTDYGRVVTPAPTSPMSDLPIPRLCDLLSRARDYRDSAVRLGDAALTKRINTMVKDKLPYARLRWELGTLHIDSPSGMHYKVTRAGCDCLNGQKSKKRECWHCMTHELLIDLWNTACESRDIEAEARPIAARIVAVRSLVWARL
jgi:hypothetical protein